MPRLLIIGYVWPEPASSAAGSRMMQLINYFLKEEYEIVFGTTARETSNMADLGDLGVSIEKLRLNDSSFDVLLKKLDPEIVLFDRFMIEEQFGWRVDNVCPKALKLLDTEDLHFLREIRQKAYREDKPEKDYYFNSDLAKREIASIYRCDLSLIISEAEMELLKTTFNVPAEILFYLPFMIQELSKDEMIDIPDYDERKDFFFIGNFLHEPNWNAVLFLKEKIWPELRKKLPDVKLQIFGAYPSQKVKNLNNKNERFIVNGWAENSADVMKNARICLAPIQFGAGLKGKLVEAMQNGVPSITTSVGAEGIKADMDWNGYVCDEINEFIGKAVSLYTNSSMWKEKQNFGFQILKERFNKKHHELRFKNRLGEIIKDLDIHRQQNFTGSMMKFHLMKSSYYLSRFIEEKNRNK
ncbi:glycosyltransferase [Christiangramia salexigens]|uniref:Glycosyltransferase n=1 Tax=Christiangramia salexigens TaxID=1913577 RepID=A0A1L3J382_9FLAO|nr:glycosyltransferase [Christiangramia salexigens]APG59584.1 glycosyltransferase [Christiangramia salexigens]